MQSSPYVSPGQISTARLTLPASEGKTTSVDGYSEFGELMMEIEGTRFKSMPSGQMLGPAYGKPRVEHQMQGSTYTYSTPSIVLRLSADGRGHWGGQIHTTTP